MRDDGLWRVKTMLGEVSCLWRQGRCARIWLAGPPSGARKLPRTHPFRDWLDAYFGGVWPAPELPLAIPATDFQARLRCALMAIPPGSVVTYGALARRLGSGARAVGRALKANPLPLVVPCHRVVAADGLGGFSAGLEWKRRLLAFEAALSGGDSPGPAAGSRRGSGP